MEAKNAKQWPIEKEAKFLRGGLVSYNDVGAGVALLKDETIQEGLNTFIGKPVIIDHSEVTPKNYEKYRKGNVTGVRFNTADAWYYVKFIIDDDEAVDCVENKGYSVSCAYNVLDVGDGGLYQDLPYDGEITKISFTHLALVTEPRYEESKILDTMPLMLVNGKIKAHNISNQEEQKMFKLFQKNKEGEQKEVTPFVVINGKEVALTKLIETFVANEKDGKAGDMDKKELYQAKDDDIVDINGHKVSIGEMKNAYTKMNEKSDDKKDDKVKDGDGVEDKKKNEKGTDEDKGEDKKGKPEEDNKDEEKRAKENSKKETSEFFLQLQEAENSKDIAQIDTTGDRPFGLTRTERADNWKNRVSKNIAAR